MSSPVDNSKKYLLTASFLKRLYRIADEWDNLIVKMTSAPTAKLSKGQAQSVLEIPSPSGATSTVTHPWKISVDGVGNISVNKGRVQFNDELTSPLIEWDSEGLEAAQTGPVVIDPDKFTISDGSTEYLWIELGATVPDPPPDDQTLLHLSWDLIRFGHGPSDSIPQAKSKDFLYDLHFLSGHDVRLTLTGDVKFIYIIGKVTRNVDSYTIEQWRTSDIDVLQSPTYSIILSEGTTVEP